MNRTTRSGNAADGGGGHFFISPSFAEWRQNPRVGATQIRKARSVFYLGRRTSLLLGRKDGQSGADTLAQDSFTTQLARIDRLAAECTQSVAGNLALLSEARPLPVYDLAAYAAWGAPAGI